LILSNSDSFLSKPGSLEPTELICRFKLQAYKNDLALGHKNSHRTEMLHLRQPFTPLLMVTHS
ncbi:MAG: hypothetical protein WBX81_12410, partial [Nitrososphaeraceae archaeon]